MSFFGNTGQGSDVIAYAAAIPLFFAGGIAPQDRQRAGTGQYRYPGAAAANTPIVVAHDLARVPVCVKLIDNATGAQADPTISARSSTSVTLTFPMALLSGAFVFIG